MSSDWTPRESTSEPAGSLDGAGCGDHDTPYVFGRRPRAVAPFPFTTRQYARLVVLRGRVQDQLEAGNHVEFFESEEADWRPAAA
jgi:hypothetical protein